MDQLILGTSVFSGCISLTSITFPPTLTDLGTDTFYGCAFTELDLSSYTYLTSIGDYVFDGCSFLTSIILPSSITSIGTGSFNSCSSLISITFTNDTILPTIYSDSFSNIGTNPVMYMPEQAYKNNANSSILQLLIANIPNLIILKTNLTCFKEGSLILTDKGYISIEKLKQGDLIHTALDGYKPIYMIGCKEIYHSPKKKRVKDQLYICSSVEYPEIFEDLVLTGCHSILVDDFKNDIEKELTININGHTYITDNKYRLPACVDNRTGIYQIPGKYKIYHLALKHDDYYMNYGIYANGLLVETCSIRFLKECSGMKLI